MLISRGVNIVLITTPVAFSLEDGWLSGFTDAEGCFSGYMKKRTAYKLGLQPVVRFILDQKDESVLRLVLDLFNTGHVSLRKDTNGVYRYESNSTAALLAFVNYFSTFPLRTVKAAAFIKWNNVRLLIQKKQHLTAEGLAEIKLLVKDINNKIFH